MGIQQSLRQFCHSLIVHSGLRNWRIAHWSRSWVAGIVAPIDFRAAQRKMMSDATISDKERNLLRQISSRIHRHDEMYIPFDARHYLSVGLSALRCIENALRKPGGAPPVKSILDLPCGYGRVLRFLRARFPDAEITASELNPSALEFCKRNFRVNIAISNADFSKLSVPGRFDLIWCGSLLTHVDENAAASLLEFFHRQLCPGGTCIFTTQGKLVADRIRDSHLAYGLGDSGRRELLAGFDERGYGYSDYSNTPGFGVSVAMPDRMLSIARNVSPWKHLSFLERGWDNHQDVYIGETA